MNLETMIRDLRDRVKITDNDQLIVDKLNSALSWAWNRIILTNPNLELTFESTGTFAADTETFDLAAALSTGQLDQLKAYWIKGAGDTDYVPVLFKDANDPEFLARTQWTAQLAQPVYVAVINYDQVRHAPTVPSGSMWRADWVGRPPSFSLETRPVPTLPDCVHDALVSRAEALLFRGIDDVRSGIAFNEASDLLSTGMKVIKRRQTLTGIKTKPYPPRRGTYL
jgi:hypothetical protein